MLIFAALGYQPVRDELSRICKTRIATDPSHFSDQTAFAWTPFCAEAEINRAANGEHIYEGFVRNRRKDQAKLVFGSILERLNTGEELPAIEIEKELQPYAA